MAARALARRPDEVVAGRDVHGDARWPTRRTCTPPRPGCGRSARRPRRCRRCCERTSGVIATSSGVHGPLGWAIGVGVGLGGLECFGCFVPFGIRMVGPVEVDRRGQRGRGLDGARVGRPRVRPVAAADEQPPQREDHQGGRAEHREATYPVDARAVDACPDPCENARSRPARRGVATPARLRSPRDERPRDAAAGLVRRPRARPALARRAGDAVVGDGLGVHAPADAGRPRRAGPPQLDGGLADARGPRRGAQRRGRPGVGPARATPAARSACTPPPRRSSRGTTARCRRRTTTCALSPASATTPPPRSRRSGSASGTPSSTPTSAGSSPAWSAASSSRPSPRRPARSAWPRACSRRTRQTPPPGRSPSWSSARSSARRPSRAATPARSRTGARGGRPATRRTTARPARRRPGRVRTGSAAAG